MKATHSAQTRRDAGVREILQCRFEGEDLHCEYQIVAKKKLSDQTPQEGVRTKEEPQRSFERVHPAVVSYTVILPQGLRHQQSSLTTAETQPS